MAFNGYLIKIGGTDFPLKYIEHKTYKVTPNQRQEKKANRNAEGELIRTTLPHTPVKIEFETLPGIKNSAVEEINSLIRSNFTVPLERKLSINYYDPEENTYKTADVYMPDTEYPIMRIDTEHNVVYYDKIRYAFIGY